MSTDGDGCVACTARLVFRVRCGQPPVHSRPGCWLARWVGLGSTSPHTLPDQTRRHVFCQVAASNSTALRSRVRRVRGPNMCSQNAEARFADVASS